MKDSRRKTIIGIVFTVVVDVATDGDCDGNDAQYHVYMIVS